MLGQLRKYLTVIKLSSKIQEKLSSFITTTHSWEKKSGDPDFDVPMGCYDGAEICELVGIFILNKLSNIIDKNSIGLYRDGGLGMFDKLSGPRVNKVRRKISKFLKTANFQ